MTAPAVVRTFKVVWYEAPPRVSATVHRQTASALSLPRPKPKRRGVFNVQARSIDVARKLAREHVQKQGATVASVNVTRDNGLLVYSQERVDGKA